MQADSLWRQAEKTPWRFGWLRGELRGPFHSSLAANPPVSRLSFSLPTLLTTSAANWAFFTPPPALLPCKGKGQRQDWVRRVRFATAGTCSLWVSIKQRKYSITDRNKSINQSGWESLLAGARNPVPTYHNSLNASLPLHRRKGLGSGKSEAWLLFTETVLPPWTSASVGNLPVLSVPAAGLAVLYSNKRNIPKLKWKCHWLSVEINPLNTFFFFLKEKNKCL